MKTLTIAAVLSLLTLFMSACSGGSTLPSVATQAAKHHRSTGGVTRNSCPGDSGGGFTGEHPCSGGSSGQD